MKRDPAEVLRELATTLTEWHAAEPGVRVEDVIAAVRAAAERIGEGGQ